MGPRGCLLVLVFLTQNLLAQPLNEGKINRLAVYGKVWGFLKYYHPKVSTGKTDWDAVLVNNYYSVRSMTNNQDFNKKITRLLDSLGYIPPSRNKALDYPDSLKRNLNIDWIYDTTYLSAYNSSRLSYIFGNHQPFKNYYISKRARVGNPDFSNEKLYGDLILPNEPYRILALFRYWNIINYYYPYLYMIDKKWDDALTKYIPRFVNITTDYEYFRKIQELATEINDGHGMVRSTHYNYFAKMHIVPVKFSSLGNNTYITDFLNDTICTIAGIQKGDIIKKMDYFEVDILRSHQAKYMPASNKTYLDYKVDQWLSLVKDDTVHLELERNNQIIQTKLPTINTAKKIKINPDKAFTLTKWKLLSDSVGYINMGLFNSSDINPAYNKLKKTRYLIIDSRNYPHWVVYPLAEKLLKTRKVFMQITEPDYDYPGFVRYEPPMKAGMMYNTDYYKGKIIILVNSETMSRAEFTVMALRQAEDVTIIGTQTAGADGDISIVPFPGGIYTYFSGLGVYHPNGAATQRIGLVPDITVTPTLEGILNGKDEYLDRALEFVRTGK